LRFQRANEKPGKAIFTALNIKPFSDRVIVDIMAAEKTQHLFYSAAAKKTTKKELSLQSVHGKVTNQ
jgi:hypothetical protein